MSKTKKFVVALGLAGAIGITAAWYTLNGMPEVFDWDEDDE